MASICAQRCHRTSSPRCSAATERSRSAWARLWTGGADFDATVWPRLAAIGERLWSSVDDVDAARPRLEAFRCLLLERGVGAAPLNNSMARTAPVGPGACTQRRRRI